MRRQRGSITKKGDLYYIVFRDLEKRQKWVGPFPNKASARGRLNEILVEINCGTYTEPKPITFKEFAENCSLQHSGVNLLVIRFNHSQTSGAFLWKTEAAGNSPRKH